MIFGTSTQFMTMTDQRRDFLLSESDFVARRWPFAFRAGKMDMKFVCSYVVVGSSSDSKIVQDSIPFWGPSPPGGYIYRISISWQQQVNRGQSKMSSDLRSEITIILSICNACSSLDQIFPSLALHPRSRRRFGRHRFSAFDAQPPGKLLAEKS